MFSGREGDACHGEFKERRERLVDTPHYTAALDLPGHEQWQMLHLTSLHSSSLAFCLRCPFIILTIQSNSLSTAFANPVCDNLVLCWSPITIVPFMCIINERGSSFQSSVNIWIDLHVSNPWGIQHFEGVRGRKPGTAEATGAISS